MQSRFRKNNTLEQLEQMGLRTMYAPRSTFSEEDDRILISLQEEHGNKWTYIADVMNEMTETEWSRSQLSNRFYQLEIYKKQGGRKKRKVSFSKADDAQIVAFRDEWLKTRSTIYGMWQAMQTKMPGKTSDDLINRWRRKLSAETTSSMTSSADSSSAVALSAVSLSAMTSLAVGSSVVDSVTETMPELPPPPVLPFSSPEYQYEAV
jgi:hypothetical protein